MKRKEKAIHADAKALLEGRNAQMLDGYAIYQTNYPPPVFLFDEIFAGANGVELDRPQMRDPDPVTIIFTSGTSGESKGVVLTAANVGFMLECTSARLDVVRNRQAQLNASVDLFKALGGGWVEPR